LAVFAVLYRLNEIPTSLVEVTPGLPAEAAGLRSGDRVVEMDGAPVTTFPQVFDRIHASGPGKPIELVVERGGQRITAKPIIDSEGHIGVKPSAERVSPSWGEALLDALPMPFQSLAIWGRALGMIAAGEQHVL